MLWLKKYFNPKTKKNLNFYFFKIIIKHKVSERQERAFYLSLAAILGDGIYNFGELLMHPILGSLNGTRDQWLVDLLFSFNRGDLEKFESLKSLWTSQADLKAAEVKMRQKICLLCLMEVLFLFVFCKEFSSSFKIIVFCLKDGIH